MRLHQLVIEGLGAFRHQQMVDFDRAATNGLFLISGNTGTGKSTILDAVSYALYGKVPRYRGDESRIRSDHCGPGESTSVRLEFSVRGERYRITRNPKYDRLKIRSKTGETTEQKAAVLLEALRGDWVGLAAKEAEAGAEILRIIGLNGEQFQQVILLAQGKFMDFLQASSEQRRAVLSAIFATGRFESLSGWLTDRKNEMKQRVAVGDNQILELGRSLVEALVEIDGVARSCSEVSVAWVAEQVTVVSEYVAAASERAELAGRAAEAAQEQLRVLEAVQDLQRRRAAARIRQVELAEREQEIARVVEKLAISARVDAIRPLLAVVADESDALVAAETELTELRETRSKTELTEAITRQQSLIGRLQGVVPDEERMSELLAAVERDQELQVQAQQVQAKLAARGQELPKLIAKAQAEQAVATVAAAQEGPLTTEELAALRRLAAAEQLLVVNSDLAAARAVLATEQVAAGAARSEQQVGLQRYLGSVAGVLAQQLVLGQPCAVCGSVTHPAPATTAEDVLSREELEDLAGRADLAEERVQAQAAVVVELGSGSAALAERAEGRSVSEAETELAEIRKRLVVASAANEAVDQLGELLAELLAEQHVVDREQVENNERCAQLRSAVAIGREKVAEIERRLVEHRGAAASVAERLVEVQSEVADLGQRLVVRRRVDETSLRLQQVKSRLQTELVEQGFGSIDCARQAILEPGVRDRLAEEVSKYRAEVMALEQVLADAAIRSAPEDPIDLVADQAQVAETEAEAKAATAEAVRLGERLRQLRARQRQFEQVLAATSEQQDEYEVLRELAETLAGRGAGRLNMNLETFVLAAKLEEIVAAANLRLRVMTDSRYELVHDDSKAARNAHSGLGLLVVDAHTGRARSPESLSGGETFVASLALALGLADVVSAQSGGIQLETLFVDEGFGALDPEALDAALTALEGLRANGRVVGLISHVSAMKERIPAAIEVRRRSTFDSEVIMSQ